ncbi:MAG: hypothetical protein A3H73_01275 [Candidatus Taylorbacteria bacterium RIFCSPLOWO2_02_FULL_50_120]|nr:MAG: hypothetical protein A2759_02880 [Candidatus Taylorbacteria bacterium RIFCSPHIGHO2_01_FULL_49_60]OHA36278.1 MAG: hypothetical protein A2W65_03025 [Candidatus Taylorbacteria bacterium RIFCSPLOWO2_02_50_13]OHA37122.1 MAG: hypothetical protein A3B27_00785 [Candidatus Taylorbacteria bacterium RIFCSPLOWO2_01_FULL_50_130]OHA40541.1 MAG: hypothetical protein A3H73_01275 [Candidatus Taylorbacteria bacterium RIFCSPLOWO2_02_FULL_50_120]
MIVQPIKTRVFQEGDDLFAFITAYVKELTERAVIVVTSKIVALAEKRTAIIKNAKTKENLIRAESEFAIPTKYVWLTVKDGMVMASAGIDESNANGKLILLPKDSFKTARLLRNKLRQRYDVRNLGVLITDSRTVPLRAGVTGVAVGYAGFRGIKDYRDTPDIFGRKFEFSRTNMADGLAAAAVLVMGEGNERQPLAIIESAPVEFSDNVNRRELYIDIQEDMYRPLFSTFPKH